MFSIFRSQYNQRYSITNTSVSIAIHSEEFFTRYYTDEIEFVKSLANLHNQSYASINFGEDVIKDMIMSSIFGIPISAKSSFQAYRLMIERVNLIARHFDDFTALPQEIQNSLLQHNADMVVSLRGADFFHARKQGQDQLFCSLGISDLQTAEDIVEEVKISYNRNDEDFKPIEYKNFNTIQEKLEDSEDEKRYDLLLSRVGTNASLDENSLILLTFVILLCSDFTDESIDAKSWRCIENAQRRMINILQRYIQCTFYEDSTDTIFNEMMQCLQDLRELCFIKEQRRKEPIRTVKFSDSSGDSVPDAINSYSECINHL